MPRVKAEKAAELESFWRAHLEAWQASELNQREYCERHGLPLKRFGNWRAKLRDEAPFRPVKVLWRRGGGLEHRLKHMSKEIASPLASYIPSGLSSSSGKRRNFSEADKRRIVAEACRPDASVSGVAKKYGLGRRLLFQWKQEFAPEGEAETTFLPVIITDEPDLLPDTHARTGMAPVIVERAAPGIEVELIGGRRVRFERDADPETVRRLVDLLEGERS
ncbi:MAG: IS66-like element accessory protein TnpA [Parvibaculaceae bacterium]